MMIMSASERGQITNQPRLNQQTQTVKTQNTRTAKTRWIAKSKLQQQPLTPSTTTDRPDAMTYDLT